MFKFLAKLGVGLLQSPLVPYYIMTLLRSKQRKSNAELFSNIALDIVSSFAQKYPNNEYLKFSNMMVEDLMRQVGLKNIDVATRLIRMAMLKMSKGEIR